MTAATAPAGIEAVVLDYGGVLTTTIGDAFAACARRRGIDPGSLTAVLRRWLGGGAEPQSPVALLEEGRMSTTDFERAFARELTGVDGDAVDPDGLLGDLFADIRPDEDMWALVDEVRAHGIRCAVLSNSWANTYPDRMFDGRFAPIVISGQVGIRKPDPAIFDLTLERLDLPAAAVVMVDDAPGNVTAAKAVGMHAIHHVDAAATRHALTGLVGLPTPGPGASTALHIG